MAVIVISGGSGLLGINWAIRRRGMDDVNILLNNKVIDIAGVKAHCVKFTDYEEMKLLIEKIKPEIFIHTAGMTSVDDCTKYPELSEVANTHIAYIGSKVCSELGVKFIHISTDHLFDGLSAFNKEDMQTLALNNYAKHKLKAEKLVMDANPNALIARTNFFGWGPYYRRSFSDIIIDHLKEKRSFNMFDDVFFTPISTRRLIDLAHELVSKGFSGIINISGGERISKYDFSVCLANAFGFDSTIIQPVQATRIRHQNTKRPMDLSLSSTKLRAVLDTPPVTIASTILDLKSDIKVRSEILEIGKIIPYGKHYIDNKDIEAVTSVLKGQNITQGPSIDAFEKKIANYVGAKYAVAVSSATAGLHLSYLALGAGPGNSVLTSPITFVATANAAIYCGANVCFADINPRTINIDFNSVKRSLNSDKSIHIVAPVDYAGAPDGIPEIAILAKEKGKFVVEDAAHGLGGSYSCGSKVGSCKYSDCTVFSLHPVKSIAAGEGGVITTNDIEIYRSLLRLRSHGINKAEDTFTNIEFAYTHGKLNPWYYEMRQLGFHYRITDIQASLASSQMDKLDTFIERRRDLAEKYAEKLKKIECIRLAQSVDIKKSANHILPVRIDFDRLSLSRKGYINKLQEKRIFTQVHYIPVVSQPFYAARGLDLKDFPNTAQYYKSALSLPLYYSLTDDEFDLVINSIEALSLRNKKNG